MGYGGSLQESCLEGFDSLGLHQVNADSGWVGAEAPHSRFPQRFNSFGLLQVSKLDVGIERSNESLVANASELALVYREHK